MQGKVKKKFCFIYTVQCYYFGIVMVCFAGTGSECYIESSSAGSYTIFINTLPIV